MVSKKPKVIYLLKEKVPYFYTHSSSHLIILAHTPYFLFHFLSICLCSLGSLFGFSVLSLLNFKMRRNPKEVTLLNGVFGWLKAIGSHACDPGHRFNLVANQHAAGSSNVDSWHGEDQLLLTGQTPHSVVLNGLPMWGGKIECKVCL